MKAHVVRAVCSHARMDSAIRRWSLLVALCVRVRWLLLFVSCARSARRSPLSLPVCPLLFPGSFGTAPLVFGRLMSPKVLWNRWVSFTRKD